MIRPKLKSGNLGNGFAIDPLEPINIDDILIQKNGLYVSLTNIKALGAANFRIDKLRINAENFKVDVIVTLPRIEAFGQYKLRMTLGVLNLDGDGNMKALLGKDFLMNFPSGHSSKIIYLQFICFLLITEDLKLKISLSGAPYVKNGEKYIRADRSTVTAKIVKMTMNFDNLFKGDKVLSDLGNSLVNQNIDLLIGDIEPSLQTSLGKA